MKKILGIVVLGFLLSGNAYAWGGPFKNTDQTGENLGPEYGPDKYEFYLVTGASKKDKKIKKLRIKANKYCQNLNRGTAIAKSWRKSPGKGLFANDFWYFNCDKKAKKTYTASTQGSSSNSSENIEFTTSIGKHKNTCKELGFTPATEAFGNCVLKLIELEVAQQGNNKAVQQIQIIKQQPAYDGWMGELGLSILKGDFSKRAQPTPKYNPPPRNKITTCRFVDGGIGGPYMNCD